MALSCRSDEEWRALVGFMGSPAWATRPELATVLGRASVEDEIEEQIEEWTSGRDLFELFHALQAAGVTAGPVMSAKDAVEDPHLAANGAWTRLPATEDYPETDFASPPYRFEKSDVRLRTEPALFAQHNEYVYRDLLGLSDEEYAKLEAEGHITDTYDPAMVASA